jgi:8-oxo-dGTP diphosphatase
MLIQNIKVAADMVVFCNEGEHLQILLVRRKYDPFQGMWALPGGFVEDDEELETAAIRELHEETGLKLEPPIRQLHTYGKVGRDPRGRTISVMHYAILTRRPEVKGGDDAADAQWVNVKDITEMAFDHKMVVEEALQQLQAELE